MVSKTKKKANQKKSSDLPPQKTCTRNKKASKVKQVIEISSSYIESIPKPDSYEHNSPKSPIGQPHNQESLVEKVSQLESSVEVIIKGLSNLTKIVETQSPLVSHNNTCSIFPDVLTQTETSGQCLMAKMTKTKDVTKTEDILAKLATKANTSSGKSSALFADLEPLHNGKYDGMKTGVDIPKWIPMSFTPLPNMILDQVQAIIAAYLFGTNKDNEMNGKEIIVTTTEKTVGDKDTLRTLLPKGLVDQEVTRPETVMEYYQHQYMGKIDYLSKIYVPMNDMSCHWYLLVVDIHEKRLVLLDSKPHPQRNVARRRNVKKLAIFLEELLLHKSFYQFPFTSKPEISEFSLVMPNDIGEQLPDL
ncbi:Ulp1 protease family, carboxy-terminal domain protein [Spatholobus suberectus]|nr:Ulp1 protease family, carboxy-terminal domain protein [Spatholobus suberectus]